MVVASTHSATAVPRIQLIAPNCASDCPESSSVRAFAELNVQQKPYSARVQDHLAWGNFSSVSAERVFTGAQEIPVSD
jgi:hypothetical protein